MASDTQEAHLPALENHGRAETGRELQATLVELVDLSLIGKQLHWNIFGRPFKPLHEHLDELVDSWRELADTVAERAVALGVAPVLLAEHEHQQRAEDEDSAGASSDGRHVARARGALLVAAAAAATIKTGMATIALNAVVSG